LRENGKIRRGALGVGIGDLDPESLEYYKVEHGARITSVQDGMPAKDAGLKTNDIIQKVNGRTVNTAADVIAAVSSKPPGEKIELLVARDGKSRTTMLELGDRTNLEGMAGNSNNNSDTPEKSFENSGLGFSVGPLSGNYRTEARLPRSLQGLVIENVDRGSMAARKGIRPGMVLMEFNGEPVADLGEMRAALKELVEGQVFPIKIYQPGTRNLDGTTIFLRMSK